MLMSRSPLSPTSTRRSPPSPTSMSRSPLSPTSTRSLFPLLPLLPPSLPTTLPPSPTPDTPSLPLLTLELTPLPPLLMPDTPSLPLPTLELTPLAFPTTVNSTLFNPFSRPQTPSPPKCPAKDAATFDSMRADLHQLQARQPVTMNPSKPDN